MNERLTWRAILGNGLLLPVALLVTFEVALAEASRGEGGFEAAYLAIIGILVTPGLLLANCWLFFRRWHSHWRVFFAGLALPMLMGVSLALMLYAPRDLSRWGNSMLNAWPWLLWAVLALFYVPLVVVVIRAIVRRGAHRDA